MNMLTDLPQEIYYLVGNYLDLRDLGSLLWTCKNLSDRIGADFPLQKIFLDNTPIKRGPRMFCLHRKFVQNRTTTGIRNNHPYGVLMSFPDLGHKTIYGVIEQNRDKVSREMNKGILNEVHYYDADKVLEFIIESYTESLLADSEVNFKYNIMKFVTLLADGFIDTQIVFNEKIVKLSPKTLTRTMDMLSKHRDFVLEAMMLECNGFKNGLLLMRALKKFNERFPEHAFDLTSPVNSSIDTRFIAGFQVPLLEFAVLCQNTVVFDYLIDTIKLHVDPNGHYLAAAYSAKNNRHRFIEHLKYQKIGLTNDLYPPYLFEKPTSILGGLIKQDFISAHEYLEIEQALATKSRKLTPEEEKEFLSMPETSLQYKAVKCAMLEKYSPLINVEDDIDDNLAESSLSFRSSTASYLRLTSSRVFEYHSDHQYIGSYIVNGSSIVCTSEKGVVAMSWGSYSDYTTYEESPHREILRFTAIRLFDGALAVYLNSGSMSEKQKLSALMRRES